MRLGSYAYNAKGSVVNYAYTNAHLGLGTKITWQIEVFENEVKVPSEMFAIGESKYANAKANSFPGGAGGEDTIECGIGKFGSHSTRVGTVRNTTWFFAMGMSQP